MKRRSELLRELVEYKTPINSILADLQAYGWDSETIHFIVSKNHLINILNRFLLGNLNAQQIVEWADSLESREDIEYDREEVRGTIFLLANPDINGAITKEYVADIKRNLTRGSTERR